ncbi:MAG: endonuclease MutS2 [Vicinamibacteria bacterium]
MNIGVCKTLELDKILAVLASHTSTPFGAEGARSLQPSSNVNRVRQTLEETSEGRKLLELGKKLPLSGTPDIRRHLDILEVANLSLPAESLLELAAVARTAQAVGAQIGDEPSLPRLTELAGRLPDLRSIRVPIEKAIDVESGEVKDDASPELKRLRAQLFKLRKRLEGLLESFFRQKDSKKALQDQVVTVRNGRSVLPVKAECRSQLVGIVHGSSASGATVFIEPLSTVEVNNDIVSLQEQERQEIERILHALTDLARSKKPELSSTVDVLGHLDLIQAKALLSEAYEGVEPRLADDKTLRLVSARHPLLVRKVAERLEQPSPSREVVPLSFRVDPEKSALVFTGPNTGGKTVALKTAGLLSLMAQAGLHVPADSESTFPVFKEIFADIGDEQSIGSSLSTFSFHLRNIVEMERDIEEPSLVLLDEVGSGTDPAEGGALGTALVDHFRRRGALVLASTHHGMLKAYATTTPGVGSASFEFDPKTFEPTYRLVEGSTGRSLAFEIARRFGLPDDVVARAQALQNEKERQVEGMLERLEEETQQLAREREKMTRDRRDLETSLRRQRAMEEELVREREERAKDAREEMAQEVARAREEIRALLAEAQRQSLSRNQKEVQEARARLETVAKRFQAAPKENVPSNLRVGDTVSIPSLRLTGQLVELLTEGEVEVLVRDKRLRIPLSDLEAAGPSPTSPSLGRTDFGEPKRVPGELNVIGCTVDEAISQADKFLDDAFLSDHRQVRLIHGLGQGRLKKAIGQWLSTHPHVAHHESEGSGAVTVVELKS